MSRETTFDLNVGVGYSTDPDSHRAGVEAVSEAIRSSGDPAITFLFTTESYDQRAVWRSVRTAIGDSKLVGVCAGGIIVGNSVLKEGVCVLTLSGAGLRVATSLQAGLSKDPRGTGQRVAKDLLSSDITKGVTFVFPDGFATDVFGALRGLYNVMGPDFRYLGGGAGDNVKLFRTYQFGDDGVASDALAVALIDGLSITTAIASGWKPRGEPLIITKAKGRTVFEINGLPAFEVYSKLLGGVSPKHFPEYGLRHPLGFPDIWGNHIIRAPWRVNPDGSIQFVSEVPEGAVGHVMTYSRELIVQSTARAVRKAVGGTRPKFVLVFDCVSRYLLMGPAFLNELQKIREAIGQETPLVGIITFGEIGPHGDAPFFHNKTLVLAVANTSSGAGATDCSALPDVDHVDMVTGELSALHEIACIGHDGKNHPTEEILEEAMSRTVRLFGLSRYALFLGPENQRRPVSLWGFRQSTEALKCLSEESRPEAFRFDLGGDGHLGVLYFEKMYPLRSRERRLYELFARQVEEILVAQRRQRERQKIFEELRESESRFRALVEQSLVGVYMTDGNYFLYVNDAFARMCEYSSKELESKAPIDLVHPDDRTTVCSLIRKGLRGEAHVVHFPFRIITRNGRIMHCETFARTLNIGGRKTIIGSVVDRTEQERLEEQVRRGQKMEALGRLAAGIAHDFGNALTAIRGNLELALLKLEEENPIRRNLQSAHNVCALATETIRKLLFFGRQQPISKTSMDLNSVVEETLGVLDRLLGEDIQVLKDLDPRLPPVEGDRAALSQVIMNLLLNARDAMPDGGSIRIKTAVVTLDKKIAEQDLEARPGHFVCLSVHDTGEGIRQELLDKIFEPFFSTKPGVGTGMGLSVAYGIAKEHGGWISVESEVGKGSLFKVYLPVSNHEQQQRLAQIPAIKNTTNNHETILVVEDDEQIRQMVETALVQAGYKVLLAAGVEEALARFEAAKGQVDLLLTDMVLPDGNAIQLIDLLLSQNEQLRVLVTSGYTEERSRLDIVRKRRFPFLQKPYSLAELFYAVTKTLRKRKC